VPKTHPLQPLLPGFGPAVGERWRNVHTRTICTVLALNQRHYNWVTIRTAGTEQIIAVGSFLKNFERYQ
jgi:hypothetical protein